MNKDKDQGQKLRDIFNKVKKSKMQQQISERGNLETEYFEKDEHDKGTDFVQKRI